MRKVIRKGKTEKKIRDGKGVRRGKIEKQEEIQERRK